MKRCLSCDGIFDSSIRNCPICGFLPATLNGFDSYSPEFAHDGGGFKSDYFSELAKLEDSNFWFRSRNKLILWAIEKYCSKFKNFLEIGCGTGYVLTGISKRFPNTKLYGSEIFVAGLHHLAERLPFVQSMQMDARNIPYDNEFDVIGAFDVIEHIREDYVVLAQMHRALKINGFILLTVPQHAWLWSEADEYACHERRYPASDLEKKIQLAGFAVIRSTSFVSIPLPAMVISRLRQSKFLKKEFDATAELNISPWLNFFFSSVLNFEIALIKWGFNFSFGGSRLVIAQKI